MLSTVPKPHRAKRVIEVLGFPVHGWMMHSWRDSQDSELVQVVASDLLFTDHVFVWCPTTWELERAKIAQEAFNLFVKTYCDFRGLELTSRFYSLIGWPTWSL